MTSLPAGRRVRRGSRRPDPQGEHERGDVLARLFAQAGQVPPLAMAAGCSVATLLIALVDSAVDPLLALSVFYLLPVLAASSRSFRVGAGSACFTAAAWCSVDLLKHGSVYSSPFVPLANAVSRLLVLWTVVALVTALRHERHREAELARIDQLTGLANSRSFYDAVEHARRTQSRTGRPLTLAYLDLDDFKSTNDRFGHAAGDRVLRHVGDVLAGAVREVDTVARLGGDEFAVLMPETPEDEAATALARVHQRITGTLPAGESTAVQVSIGAVTFLAPLSTVDAMISRADNVMYDVKRAGKNRVSVSSH